MTEVMKNMLLLLNEDVSNSMIDSELERLIELLKLHAQRRQSPPTIRWLSNKAEYR